MSLRQMDMKAAVFYSISHLMLQQTKFKASITFGDLQCQRDAFHLCIEFN